MQQILTHEINSVSKTNAMRLIELNIATKINENNKTS